MGIQVGLNGVVYYSTATGSGGMVSGFSTPSSYNVFTGTPTSANALSGARNVTLNSADMEADFSTRASVVKLSGLALQEVGVDIDIPNNPTDAGFLALRNAHTGRTPIQLLVMDNGNNSGSFGFGADFVIIDFPREEPIDKEQLIKVKAKPTLTTLVPQWCQHT